jgi:hypothetical protein
MKVQTIVQTHPKMSLGEAKSVKIDENKKKYTMLAESKFIIPEGMLVIEGVIGVSDVMNENQRIYPFQEYKRHIEAIQPQVKKGLYGEMFHPEGMEIDLERETHRILEVKLLENGDVWGKFLLLDTPHGKICQSRVRSGGELPVSSRGYGSIDESNIVTLDVLKTWDVVNEGGFSQAQMRQSEVMTESKKKGSAYQTFIFEKGSNLNKGVQKEEVSEEIKQTIENLLERIKVLESKEATETVTDNHDLEARLSIAIAEGDYNMAKNIKKFLKDDYTSFISENSNRTQRKDRKLVERKLSAFKDEIYQDIHKRNRTRPQKDLGHIVQRQISELRDEIHKLSRGQKRPDMRNLKVMEQKISELKKSVHRKNNDSTVKNLEKVVKVLTEEVLALSSEIKRQKRNSRNPKKTPFRDRLDENAFADIEKNIWTAVQISKYGDGNDYLQKMLFQRVVDSLRGSKHIVTKISNIKIKLGSSLGDITITADVDIVLPDSDKKGKKKYKFTQKNSKFKALIESATEDNSDDSFFRNTVTEAEDKKSDKKDDDDDDDDDDDEEEEVKDEAEDEVFEESKSDIDKIDDLITSIGEEVSETPKEILFEDSDLFSKIPQDLKESWKTLEENKKAVIKSRAEVRNFTNSQSIDTFWEAQRSLIVEAKPPSYFNEKKTVWKIDPNL